MNRFFVFQLLLYFSLCRFVFPKTSKDSNCTTSTGMPKTQAISVYYINMNTSTHRREYMEHQLLNRLKFQPKNIHRVEAISPTSPRFNITLLEKPCKRNTDRDLSVILSHLTAIHTAVYDKGSNAMWALILEDDVSFLFDVDWDLLVTSIRRSDLNNKRTINSKKNKGSEHDWGILQLTTSNLEALDINWSAFVASAPSIRPRNEHMPNRTRDRGQLWSRNTWNLLTKDKKYPLYWSAQAYLVNKKVLKPFIDDVVDVDANTGELSFKIVNSFHPKTCKRTKERPCVLSNCLFSDSYIFSGGAPTFVSNVPLLVGAEVGLRSDLHQNQVHMHELAFARIRQLVGHFRNFTTAPALPLPPFLSLLPC